MALVEFAAVSYTDLHRMAFVAVHKPLVCHRRPCVMHIGVVAVAPSIVARIAEDATSSWDIHRPPDCPFRRCNRLHVVTTLVAKED